MRAIVFDEPGGPEVLRLAEAPEPELGPDDLLVNVRSAALNRADTLQRRGLYPPPPGDSEILGLELAGDVVACGENVTTHQVGDRVFGLVGGGAYAERALLVSQMAMPIPAPWSYEDAAALPEVFFTANETLFVLGGLTEGMTALIHAGASGVGTAAIQMCRHAGVRTFVTAGSSAKIDRCVELGATAGVNYKEEDFGPRVAELTDGDGVDVILDFIGADYFERNLRALKPGGRLVLAAAMSGAKTDVNLGLILAKRLHVIGSVMRSRSLAAKIAITDRFRQRWLPAIESGEIRPVVECRFPLAQAAEAHRYMEENRNTGKIMLTFDD